MSSRRAKESSLKETSSISRSPSADVLTMVEAISSLEVGIPLPNKKWSTSKTPSIEDIVVDELLRSSFYTFMKATFAEEFLEFYLDATNYEQIQEDYKRKQMYCIIVDQYFSQNSGTPLNVTAACMRQVNADRDVPSKTTFQSSKAQVTNLMQRDSLPRFFESKYFKDYLENVPDTPQEVFSRLKATDFFGELIVGPLKRTELINFEERVSVFNFSRRQQLVNRKRARLLMSSKGKSFAPADFEKLGY